MNDITISKEFVAEGNIAKMGTGAFAIYIAICAQTDTEGQASCTTEQICKATGMAERSVRNKLKVLENMGFITKKETLMVRDAGRFVKGGMAAKYEVKEVKATEKATQDKVPDADKPLVKDYTKPENNPLKRVMVEKKAKEAEIKRNPLCGAKMTSGKINPFNKK